MAAVGGRVVEGFHRSWISSRVRPPVSGTLRRIQTYDTTQTAASRKKVVASPIASTIVRKNWVIREAAPSS